MVRRPLMHELFVSLNPLHMSYKTALLLFICCKCLVACSQSLPVISASTRRADILDGNNFRRAYWTILPGVRPDIYYAQRSETAKDVVFYTDLDSIRFTVRPGGQYDFIILLNGKDSCYTRISTLRKPYTKECLSCPITTDTIPIRLGSDNKVHLTGRINGSEPLDFMFDTGADQLVLYRRGARKVHLTFDGKIDNTGFGGTQSRDISQRNTLQIQQMIWKDESVMQIDDRADDADGIIGFNIFEDRVVEIDFDKWIMVIHHESYDPGSGYVKYPITYEGTLPQIPLSLTPRGTTYTHLFVVDMGAGGGLFLTYPSWKNKEYQELEVLSRPTGRGVGKGSLQSNFTRMPKVSMAGQEFLNVPTGLATSVPEGWEAHNLLGMDLLKRFNLVIDYRQHQIYLKPNSLKNVPYMKGKSFWWLWLCGGTLVAAVVYWVWSRKRKKGAPASDT